MIIGEAPGQTEDEQGRPFIGKAGKLLRRVLRDAGFREKELFITNAVACRPPENRTPRKSEIKACRKWLQYQMQKVKPKYVLLLGNTPLESVLDMKGINKVRGKPIERDGIIYLPTYHPSYINYNDKALGIFETDIATFRQIVEQGRVPEDDELNFTIVDTWNKFDELIDNLHGIVSFDIETNQLYPFNVDSRIQSIGFGIKGRQWTIPFHHPESIWDEDDLESMVEQLDDAVKDCKLCAQFGKFDVLWMRVQYGVVWEIEFDTGIAHYMLDENSNHGLKYLAQLEFGAPNYDVDIDEKQGAGPLWQHCKYLGHDLLYTRKLRFKYAKRLLKDTGVKQVFDHVMMPCVNMFAEAEYRGVYINTKQMKTAEKLLKKNKRAAKKILDTYAKDVNWGSPKQLAEVLFDKLGLDIIEETKTGLPATNESVIKRLDHPIAKAILDYREASKNLSSFIEGWKPFLVKSRLHPSFKLHGTVTGRLSCTHPNLQQVPRDPKIRSLITAPDGWTLVECDLSQIELRIAAQLSGDPALNHAFTHGIDVHWLTAIREIARGAGMSKEIIETAWEWRKKRNKTAKRPTYGMAVDDLLKMGPDEAISIWVGWKENRKKAKAINFGYLYGMWWKKFMIYARDNYGVTVTAEEAEASRDAYFDLYHTLPDWHKRQKRYAREVGYVRSLSGRKRRLPDAMLPYKCPERDSAERQAINSPVQSFANDLNLMAALELWREFPRNEMWVVGTVHDSILFEVRDDCVERFVRRALEVMQRPKLLDTLDITLRVPIEAEEAIGPWSKGIKLEKWLNAA